MAVAYNSIYKGSQIDQAIGVVRDSSVTAVELERVHDVTPGQVTAEKVAVFDASRNLANVAQLRAESLRAGFMSLQNLSSHPVTSPPAGFLYLYFRNGILHTKNSSGQTAAYLSGQKKEFPFTTQSVINCEHNLGVTWPMVELVIDGVPVPQSGYERDPVDGNNMTIRLNSAQSGRVIIREV